MKVNKYENYNIYSPGVKNISGVNKISTLQIPESEQLTKIYKHLERKYASAEYQENKQKLDVFLSAYDKCISNKLYANIPDRPFTI